LLPLLLDAGLPHSVAAAFRLLGLDARAVGDSDAPAKNSDDHALCAWCAERHAVLVTNDRGKKDRTMLDALARHHVDAIFVYADLRDGPAHKLARALLLCEGKMEAIARGRSPIRHRLRPGGGLEKR
jgi:hypothetical protein